MWLILQEWQQSLLRLNILESIFVDHAENEKYYVYIASKAPT